MRIIFYAILLACPCLAALGQNALESPFGNIPTVTKREAAILKKASAQSDESIKILMEAAGEENCSAAMPFTLGNFQYRSGNFEAAAAAYSSALEKMPNFFAARKNLAYSLDRIGKEKEARENFAKALALSGNSDIDILLWLAAYAARRADYSAALSCVEQALIQSPERLDALYAKAFYLFNLDMYTQAAKICEDILNKKFPDAAALKLLGKCRAKLQDAPGAIAAFSMVPESDADRKKTQVICADILFSKQAYLEAAKIYESEGYRERLLEAAKALAHSGESEKSLKLLSKLPESNEKSRIRAVANMALGKKDEAKRDFLKCVESAPDDPLACFELAKIYFAEGDFNAAKIYYERAGKDESYAVAAKIGLMSVAVKTGDINSAIAMARSLYIQTRREDIGEYLQYLKNAKTSGNI